MSKKYSRIKSFKFAFEGLGEALKNEPNFIIQLFLGVLAITLGVFFKFYPFEWLILILTISIVLILELINTSVEAIVDLVSEDVKDKAKVAKDVSAAAVLIASIMSIAVGVFLFLPKILVLLI